MNNKLTSKQQAFIEFYADPQSKSFNNGVESARRANYKGNDRTLAAIASENLTKPNIISGIAVFIAGIKEKTVANRAQRQQFWTDVMQASPHMGDRLRASELLGKSEADFTENIINKSDQQPEPLTEQELRELKRMAILSTNTKKAVG